MILIRIVGMPIMLIALALFSTGVAADADCDGSSRITHDFDNGARWDFCWESRVRENLVLSDIHYKPPEKEPFRVMGSVRLSQLHVAYDDSDVTYNDVTQYGLGGSYLQTLTQADCPDGELLNVQTRPALCLSYRAGSNGYRTATRATRSASINLFSVSQVGAYAYVISWTFYDDGSFEPGVGATGALQRSSDNVNLPFGRVLQGDPDTLWLSHTHTYYWRLDFDLGESASDDTVAELRFTHDLQGRRELNTQTFITEQARRIDPDTQLMWRIMDGDSSTGYQLEPVRTGHRFERADVEPYTDFDFFVTVGNDCERFASQNARFNPDCPNHVLQFVDGQSIRDEDIVVWNRVSFHHTPRSEDQRHMHTHWDDFLITPVNVLDGTSALAGLENTPPRFTSLPDQQSAVGELIHADMIRADDSDDDVLSYTASGLPPGLAMRPDGHIHGTTSTEGRFLVRVSVHDAHEQIQSSFIWVVGEPTQDASKSAGWIPFLNLIALMAISILRMRRKPAHP